MKKIKFIFILLVLCMISIPTSAATCKKNFLSANGNKIYDSNGQEVRLTGVNWFGFETAMGFFHGIWARDHKSMLQQIKDQGFNCIRVPWNNAIFNQDITGKINSYGTDAYTGVSPMNKEEATKTKPIEILDIMINWCQENDMKVILDNHSREPDGYLNEALWYTAKVSHQKWIEDWVFLTNRYKDYDAVIAMDINNEPHGAYGGGSRWGTGDKANDWRLAAQECGNAILAANPDVLIFVEGTQEFENTSYWWGGNLQGARNYPVVLSKPEKLVYSPHEYGPTVHEQSWFLDPSFPSNMPGIWEKNFNFLHTNGTSPLFVGEFGIKDAGGKDEIWFDTFLEFMGQKGYSWTFWCWNPNSGDTGGLLDDQWKNIITWKMNKLKPYLAPAIPNCTGSTGNIAVTSIDVTPDSLSINKGTTTPLEAEIKPINATNKSITWSSNNLSVATVNTSGSITALSKGTATVTAKTVDGGFTDNCVITVTDDPLPTYTLTTNTVGTGTVTLDPAGGSYTQGQNVTLTANPGANFDFTSWSGDVSGTNASVTITMNANKSAIATFTESVNSGCSGSIIITLPHKKDGEGEFCWETSEDIGFVNSWNLDLLEINGVDFTNTWANNMPPKQSGKYYFKYKASVPWAHIDIEGKSGKSTNQTSDISETENKGFSIYPNPAAIIVAISGLENARRIKIYSILGQTVFERNIPGEAEITLPIDNYKKGSYIISVEKRNGSLFNKVLLVK